MTHRIEWQPGSRDLPAQLDSALIGGAASEALTPLFERPGRRRAFRFCADPATALFVKQFLPRSRLRRAAAAIGLDAAAREWRALSALTDRGVAVPEPLALGRLPDGSRVVVTRYLDGVTLKDRLAEPMGRRARVALLEAVGDLVRRFHLAGFAHRDLHWGNVLVTGAGPVLLDLQAAVPVAWEIARRRDLGSLDHSVASQLSIGDRVRLRAAALGCERPFGVGERVQLQSIGAASIVAGRAHWNSRARRSLKPGRRFAPIRYGVERGMRRREIAESEIRTALDARRRARDPILKADRRSRVIATACGDRSWIVKEFRADDWKRRLADGFRGSAARRAWLGAHGLLARGIGVATPVAFVERRRFGLPVASAIVLEDLRHLEPADRCPPTPTEAAEVVRALVRLAIALHRIHGVHGDLKASHVLLEGGPGQRSGRLIDLEGVRFPRRLSDRARIRALAQLNASLPDEFPDAERLAAFRRYAAAVPFRGDPRRCLHRIVSESLERGHRWSGRHCDAREITTQRK